ASRCGFEDEASAGGVAIALRPFETKGDRVVSGLEVIAHQAKLRRIAIVLHDVEIAVKVEIQGDKRAAVLLQVEAGDGREIRESSIAQIPVSEIALVAAEISIQANQPVQRCPSAFVTSGARLIFG